MRNPEVIELPFRIMPSRPRNKHGPLALIAIGTVLFGAGIWDAVDGPPDGLGSALMLIVGLALIAICTFWFFREQRYFDSRNEYWIEIGLDEFALVTPDGFDRSSWTKLTAFEVRKTTHRHDQKVGKIKIGEYETYSFAVVARYGGLEVQVPLGDFATRLSNDDEGRAQAICEILNSLRQEALSRQVGKTGSAFQVPPGLVVATMPPPRKAPLVVNNSVIQRS
ncbi:MAG TPA: hypothetical protein VJV39_11710 [Dongiaceae bacterium]|nr:hypothetical protein [Dongiaceae bacterium]